ncbi:MAG TPA: hypothetical protein VNO30_09900 [Kofleriaceae bacterium]|nr:hypothetical protein [Kofleriaceae bacterium]
MRTLSLLIAIAAAACITKRNEAVCCVSEADCARLGVDEPRPCEVGQACKDFACVAAECDTSAECTSPAAPVCIDHLCVAACRVDTDCAGAAGGPRCAEDGACVGCFSHTDCPAGAPLCDAEDRSCRGCEADAECASGVCLEADAVCAEPGQLVYVRNDGVDIGSCTRDMPCQTLSFALGQVTPSRDVIRVVGGSLSTPLTTITLDRAVTIDASNTAIGKPFNGPLFSVGSLSRFVTLGGLRLLGSSNPSDPMITVASGSLLRVVRSVLDTAMIDVANGGLELRDVRAVAGSLFAAVQCTNGTVSARRVEFEHTAIHATNCQLNVSRCRFDEISDGSITAQGGAAIFENNLVLQAYELADTLFLMNMAPGSRVRFNTFVNTSGVVSSGTALSCDATLEVSSNIFAYGSAYPLGTAAGMCRATHSLFDTAANPEQTMGQGNVVADAATFFVDRAAQDFHLSAASPARAAAAAASVADDFDGKRRPAPAGSRADIGCYEAP